MNFKLKHLKPRVNLKIKKERKVKNLKRNQENMRYNGK